MFAGSRLLLPVSNNFITLVPKPGRKEGHAVREPSLLSGIAVLRRSGSRKWRRPPVAARSGGAGAKEGGGNRRTFKHFNNKITKHNRKAAAPRGRLPHTKHKLKSRPGPLSSSTVVTPPFIPSGAPPWDSRPVSGAGVVHYHSLHRPRSVPTALGPAPLVTFTYAAFSQLKLQKSSHL